MKKTKIDWCDSTVNCVYGCPNNCEYCYGRVMNNRFHFCEDWSKPEWKPEHLKEFAGKKPRNIFIDSMSDIGTWNDEWLTQVCDEMMKHNRNWYLALTKTDINKLERKLGDYQARVGKILPIFIGKSITTQSQVDSLVKNREITDFLSIEPLLEPLDMTDAIYTTQTVIIGAETGNRKGRVIPQRKWVDDIVALADKYNIKVFMKGSLRSVMDDDFRQDRLAWEV